MTEAQNAPSLNHPGVQELLETHATVPDKYSKLIRYVHDKVHPLVENWHLEDDTENNVVSAWFTIQDRPRAKRRERYAPLFQYDEKGHVATVNRSSGLIDDSDPRQDYEKWVATLSPPSSPNRWDMHDFWDILGRNLNAGANSTAHMLRKTTPGAWLAFEVNGKIFPERDKITNLLSMQQVIDTSGSFLHGLPPNPLRSYVTAQALDIDLIARIHQIEELLFEKLDEKALERAPELALSGNEALLVRYNRAIKVGTSLDKVNEYQPGVHALYRKIYDSELSRRMTKHTLATSHAKFLEADDKTAIAAVKHAIGDELSKGQWKHLTRMTPSAIDTMFPRYDMDSYALKDRKRAGWLMTVSRYRWNRYVIPASDESEYVSSAHKDKLVLWHEYKLGLEDSVKDKQLRDAVGRHGVLEINDYSLIGRNERALEQEEFARRRENYITSMKALLRTYKNSSEKELELIGDDLNEMSGGEFGDLDAFRFLSLVGDWLADIRPVLDKNQLKAPIGWWHAQQKAWHEAMHRVPGLHRYHRLNQRAELSLAWGVPIEEHRVPIPETDETNDAFIVAKGLTNATELQDEGRAMSHCVGSYARRCYEGATRIYALVDQSGEEKLATLELRANSDGTWVKGQCLGKYNRKPPQYVLDAAKAFVKTFNRTVKELQKQKEQEQEDQEQIAA